VVPMTDKEGAGSMPFVGRRERKGSGWAKSEGRKLWGPEGIEPTKRKEELRGTYEGSMLKKAQSKGAAEEGQSFAEP